MDFAIEPVYIFINGLETSMLRTEINVRLKQFLPDMIILQVGIVDCAPRALTKTQMAVISRMGFAGKVLHKFITKHYAAITSRRNITYTSQERFHQNLRYLRDEFANIPVFAIAIGRPNEGYVRKSPKIAQRTTQYNEIIKSTFGTTFIDPYENLSINTLNNIYMTDFHHLNQLGHEIVASKVVEKLRIDIFNNLNKAHEIGEINLKRC